MSHDCDLQSKCLETYPFADTFSAKHGFKGWEFLWQHNLVGLCSTLHRAINTLAASVKQGLQAEGSWFCADIELWSRSFAQLVVRLSSVFSFRDGLQFVISYLYFVLLVFSLHIRNSKHAPTSCSVDSKVHTRHSKFPSDFFIDRWQARVTLL